MFVSLFELRKLSQVENPHISNEMEFAARVLHRLVLSPRQSVAEEAANIIPLLIKVASKTLKTIGPSIEFQQIDRMSECENQVFGLRVKFEPGARRLL